MDQHLYPSTTVDNCDCVEQVPAPVVACEECVQQCVDEPCTVGLTPECTDQCHVVTCNDAHHEGSDCDDHEIHQACVDICPEGPACDALEDFFLCCTENHDYMPEAPAYTTPSHAMASNHNFTFDASIEAFLCGCAPHGAHVCDQSAVAQAVQSNSSANTTPDMSPSPALSEAMVAQLAHNYYIQQQQQASFHQQTQYFQEPVPNDRQDHYQRQAQMAFTSQPQYQQQGSSTATFHCRWADCPATFPSENELVGHVVLQHLRVPSSQQSQPQQSQYPAQAGPSLQQQTMVSTMDANALACLWADCNVFPTPESIPGPSNGTLHSALGVLQTHLLEHHLGIPAHASPKLEALTLESASSGASTPLEHELGLPTPAAEHDCSAASAHVCAWRECGQTFGACDALTQHIAEKHVGGGKAHYDCFWEGCTRNGDAGFASKQKILRHLQSHTGHRPFQCETCGQNFSEAATLAQHMRRHTQEKPYVCDYPGCGKAFAITGALTIHKRTHNGHKPFKCKYCDRAFAESSNLSKHIRTHTGARPYPCAEPGCNKSFARPDQLTRHMNVHRKKSVEGAAEQAGGKILAFA